MGLRQKLNEKPRVAAAAAGVLVLAAVMFLFVQSRSGGGFGNAPQAYYTVDDGKSWFAADASKIPPFQHEGKTAYRVKVYRCGEDGEPFVSHLERYSEADKRQLETPAAGAIAPPSVEIKKPGQPEWIRQTPQTMEAFLEILQPKCPDGGEVEPVLP
jgi:hypothetical protein